MDWELGLGFTHAHRFIFKGARFQKLLLFILTERTACSQSDVKTEWGKLRPLPWSTQTSIVVTLQTLHIVTTGSLQNALESMGSRCSMNHVTRLSSAPQYPNSSAYDRLVVTSRDEALCCFPNASLFRELDCACIFYFF